MTNLLSLANYQSSLLPTWVQLNHQLWDLADQLGSTPPGFTPPSSSELGPALLNVSSQPLPVGAGVDLNLEGK